MMNKKERMTTLANNGIDTTKYFSFTTNEPIPAGSKITVSIESSAKADVKNSDGYIVGNLNNYTFVTEMVNELVEDEYVGNNHLFRRWVMAQMFRALNTGMPLDTYVEKNYKYTYQFDVIENELNVLAKVEKEDYAYFVERSRFFTKDVVVQVCKDYVEEIKKFLRKKKFYGFYCYNGNYYGLAESNVYFNILWGIIDKMENTMTFKKLYEEFKKFKKNMADIYRFNKEARFSKAFKNAYKGAGAYYTCQNLIRFHGCLVEGCTSRTASEMRLIAKTDEYDNEWFRLYAFMKKLIQDNDFHFGQKAWNHERF